MKLLNGTQLAEFIKERQAKQVRSLRQAHGIIPRLAIVQTKDDPVINTYVRLKKHYGQDILAEVEPYFLDQAEAANLIKKLNKDDKVHGIIVQLPLVDTADTDKLVNLVTPSKDVDALGKVSEFDPATPMAILWLLAGYNIDLANKQILLIGRGKLVGQPLERIFKTSGYSVKTADRNTKGLRELTIGADIIITATGSPNILFPDMVKNGAVVVDAGVASEEGKTVGDISPALYERDDLTITPDKGGVGPLTVCALFDNLIRSARRVAEESQNE